jgi:microcin C transport system substrate-binding protein
VQNNVLVNEKGQPFEFEIMLVQPTFERVINPYIQALKKLGIQAHIRHVEVSQYINRLRRFDFDMIIYSYGQSLSPGNEQLEFWHSSRADQPGSRNLAGIKNPVVDAMVQQVITAPDRDALINRSRALDRVLLHGAYVIPQWHINSHRIAYWDKFQRPAVAPKYDGRYNMALLTWWFDANKAAAIKGQ